MSTTVNICPSPNHGLTAKLVFFVHEWLISSQTGKVQSSQVGSSPIKTLASEDFPTPVEPMMMMCGSGSVVELSNEINLPII